MTKNYIDKLITVPESFNKSPENSLLFFQAMKEAFKYHYEKNSFYRRLCQLHYNFTPAEFNKPEDLVKLPYIFVNVFKKRKLLSIPAKEIKLTLTSSGTTGEKSAMYLDEKSLSRITQIVHNVYNSYGLLDKNQRVNYLCFTYDIRYAKNIGTAFSDKLLSSLTKVNKIYYAIEFDKLSKSFKLNYPKLREVLEDYTKDKLPVRILGFPGFLHEAVNKIVKERGRPFKFGHRSYILSGGGWKSVTDKEIPKYFFKAWAEKNLGIPGENLRDLYGLVEHGPPYVECEKGNMHVPIYSKVQIRDAGNLRILPHKKVGLIQLMTPYLTAMPAISILTSDLGMLKKSCPCGRSAPVLEIKGRAGTTKHKGCAITAMDILK